MMYNLRVIFTGICAFVTRDDDAQVLLPDARFSRSETPHPTGGNGHGHSGNGSAAPHHPPHVPVVQFPMDLFSPDSERQPDLVFRKGTREYGLCFLDRETVSFGPEPPGVGRPELNEGLAPHDHDIPQNAEEERDLRWLADIGRLDEATARVDPRFLDFDPPPGLAARIELRGGQLGTLFVTRRRRSPSIREQWEFVFPDLAGNTPHNYTQALAEMVAWDRPLSAAAGELTLSFQYLAASGHPARRLRLAPGGAPSGHTVEIFIKNMPLDDVLEVAPGVNQNAAGGNDYDTHFDLFYGLSEVEEPERWIPRIPGIVLGTPWCPPARMRV